METYAEQIAEAVINCSSVAYLDDSHTEFTPESDPINTSSHDTHDTHEIIAYDRIDELEAEEIDDNYHRFKDSGDWYYAKMIITNNNKDPNTSEYLWDYLENQFIENNDYFENIQKVYYKSDLDIEFIYDFEERPVAKYIVENIKIPTYKSAGYIFSTTEKANKWPFKIAIITTKGIYTVNRYISDTIIGCY